MRGLMIAPETVVVVVHRKTWTRERQWSAALIVRDGAWALGDSALCDDQG